MEERKIFRIKDAIEITRCEYFSRYLRMIYVKKKKKKGGRKIPLSKMVNFSKNRNIVLIL